VARGRGHRHGRAGGGESARQVRRSRLRRRSGPGRGRADLRRQVHGRHLLSGRAPRVAEDHAGEDRQLGLPQARRPGQGTAVKAEIDAVAELLRGAAHVVVSTGAGVSAESGVPTFRDAQSGLWARFDAQTLATPEAFADDPDLVWGWYTWRRR